MEQIGTALTNEELLIVLIEECSEVIQAATKCLRFGYSRDWPDYGVNHEVLAKEIGDVEGIVELLPLNSSLIKKHRDEKADKIIKWKKYFEEHPIGD